MTKKETITTIGKILKKLSLKNLKKVLEFAQSLISTVIVVKNINRSQTITEAIDATEREQYISNEVVKEMPRNKEYGDSVELKFLEPNGRSRTRKEVNNWYTDNDLIADPDSLLECVTQNLDAADDQPLACQWKDKKGKYCYLLLDYCRLGRRVIVDRTDHSWLDGYRIVGIPKNPKAKLPKA